jgi:hypothetical protein
MLPFIKHGHRLANWLGFGLMVVGLSVALVSPAWGSKGVGRVITVAGEVTATGGAWEGRPLRRRDRVYEQDVIRTGAHGRVKIRFHDEGMVDIKPDSRFEVERYRQQAKGEGREGAFMRLWKGAFRTVTGAIGSQDPAKYRVETPAATLGIRGTQYAARYCEGDCGNAFRTGEGVKDGLYVKVEKGRVAVSNQQEARSFGEGEYSFVASADSQIIELERPPGLIFSGDDPFRDTGAGGASRFRPAPGQQSPYWPGSSGGEGQGPGLLMDEQGGLIGVEPSTGDHDGEAAGDTTGP